MKTTLSINLPDHLAKASQDVAAKIGISRSEFIRQAIAHEINQFKKQLEEEAIIKSMKAMKRSKDYLKEYDHIMSELNCDLAKYKTKWWKK